MKKLNMNVLQGSALNRDELKKILGGVSEIDSVDSSASCTAKCRKGSVSCIGSGCTATDYKGCSSSIEIRNC